MTTTSTLTIHIDPPHFAAFAERGLRLVVAKCAPGSVPNAVWLAWRPLCVNIVSWTETYCVYAAPVPKHAGDVITPIAMRQPAVECMLHPFSGTAFGACVRDASIPLGHYDVRNDASFPAGFGLMQSASVNTVPVLAPLNLVVLPPRLSASFTSQVDLYVWVQPNVRPGTAVSTFPSHARRLSVATASATPQCLFDDLITVFFERRIEP